MENRLFGRALDSLAWEKSTGDSGSVTLVAGRNLTVDEQYTVIYTAVLGNETNDNGVEVPGTGSKGNAGNVDISTGGNVSFINGGFIYSHADQGSTGNTGNVSVHAQKDILINEESQITGRVGIGKAGTISVTADGNITNSGLIQMTANGGENNDNSGRVNVRAGGDLDIKSKGEVASNTLANRNAANIEVNSGKNLVVNGTIGSRGSVYAKGNTGNVLVHANGDILLDSGYIFTLIGSANSIHAGQGDTGSVSVTTDGKLTLENKSDIYSFNYNDNGHIGDVIAKVLGDVIINDKSFIGASTFSKVDAGNVHIISGGNLGINNSGSISSNTAAEGAAGNIIVDIKGNINLNNGSIFSSSLPYGDSKTATGNAGTIDIHAQGAITLNNNAYISSTSYSIGQGGKINITAGAGLQLKNGSIISTLSDGGAGSAGSVAIWANDILLENSLITSASHKSESSGQVGKIFMTANNAIVLIGSQINNQNEATSSDAAIKAITPGIISLSAKDINMTHSIINSSASGNNAASNITINFSHWLTQDTDSYIQTSAVNGNGGAITIQGGQLISLRNSGFITTAGNQGNGGNINVTADVLIMDTGVIQANANGGNGGGINLYLKALIPSGDSLVIGGAKFPWQAYVPNSNVIQAASQSGTSGVPNITAPQLNLSGVLANIGNPQFDNSILSPDYCEVGKGSTLSRKGRGGLLPKGGDLLF